MDVAGVGLKQQVLGQGATGHGQYRQFPRAWVKLAETADGAAGRAGAGGPGLCLVTTLVRQGGSPYVS